MDKRTENETTNLVGADGSSAIWLVTEHGAQPLF